MDLFKHRLFGRLWESYLTTALFPLWASISLPIPSLSSKGNGRMVSYISYKAVAISPFCRMKFSWGCLLVSLWRHSKNLANALDFRLIPVAWHFCVTRLHTSSYWQVSDVRNQLQNLVELTNETKNCFNKCARLVTVIMIAFISQWSLWESMDHISLSFLVFCRNTLKSV